METTKNQILRALSKANKLFRKKDYFDSLEQYAECLRKIPKSPQQRTPPLEDLQLLAISLRGMNYAAIREFDKAKADFGYVLQRKQFDATTLMRRASLHLKLKSYGEALEDISRLIQIQPDSIRVAALLLQAKDKLSKLSEQEQKSQLVKTLDQINNLETDEVDEEQALNFCNLKKIDRKSVQLQPNKRISQVAFKEDMEVSYETSDNSDIQEPFKRLSGIQIKQILQAQREEEVEKQGDAPSPKISIICKPFKSQKKSILKNCSIKIMEPTCTSISSADQQVFHVVNLKDVEGKPIRNSTLAKVKFRKSQIDSRDLPFAPPPLSKPSRKSCLKQSLYGIGLSSNKKATQLETIPQSQKRNSRSQSFLRLRQELADGKIIKPQSIHRKQQGKDSHQSGSDSGDEYNIFGSGAVEISEKLKKTLGLSSANSIEKENKPIQTQKLAKKSILKKNSIFCNEQTVFGVQHDTNTQGQATQSQLQAKTKTKPKKSVLFKASD